MNSTTLYGIKNCDTVKKARKWLDSRNINYQFHDFRSDGLKAELVSNWFEAVGWESLLNKRGTTWRQLPAETKDTVNGTNILPLIIANPTLIKRPVLTLRDKILIGFNDTDYTELFEE